MGGNRQTVRKSTKSETKNEEQLFVKGKFDLFQDETSGGREGCAKIIENTVR